MTTWAERVGVPADRYSSLRTTPWEPHFEWLTDRWQVAEQINSFHDDYPKYVQSTYDVLGQPRAISISVPTWLGLRNVHIWIFNNDKDHEFRRVNVVVGSHTPPRHERVEMLMRDMDLPYLDPFKTRRISVLENWYHDFETVHPFEDGNGRVGGVAVALYSHMWYPEKGWYTVKQ